MNVVALRTLNHDDRAFPATDGRIARIEVYDDFAAVEPHWRALEQAGNLATPYQTFDFLRLWHRHIGDAAGVTPCIVAAFNAKGTPLLLWPFGRRTFGGLRVVEFLGGKHANFNMALWRRHVAAQISADELRDVLAHLGAQADIVMLVNQPLTWAGTTNPFALLPQQRSANFGFSGALIPDFEALFRARTNAAARKKMRKKERALAEFGAVRFARAESATEIRHVLDAFFKQKAVRMRAQGLPDVFGAPSVRRFIEAATTTPTPDGQALIELYALSVDDIVVATMGGIAGDGRFCAMFNSMKTGRFAVESPGEQLLVHLVRQCCERGFDTFDLGIGEAHYKSLFCSDAEPLFDSYWPLTGSGRRVAFAFRIAAAIKRGIKQHPALWSVIRAVRCLRARLSNV
ncbi:MAG: GNAT family N-acetyltransferase [Pseudolabrys sp.]|nr:GNAT family N-acetyltransferase [Pseudolabrys sp.]